MAKITELPVAGPLSGTEPVIVVQDGEARRSTIGAVVEEVAQPSVDQAAASALSASIAAAFNVPWLGIVEDPGNAGAYLIPALELWPAEQRLWRDGAVRNLAADAIVHGDGSFTFNTVPAALSAGSTVIFEIEHDFGNAVAGTIYSQASNTTTLAGGFTITPRLASAGGGLGFCGARITNAAAANATADLFQYGISRFAFAVPASGDATYQADDGVPVAGPASTTYATPIRLCVGRRVDNAQILSGVMVKRVIVYAGKLTDAQIAAILAATDPEPIPAPPATVPKWVPEIAADDGSILRPLMHPDWVEGLCWFENAVHKLADVLELRGAAPNQQWVAKRVPRGLRHTLGWTISTDIALPAAWQALGINPGGQIFQAFNPAVNAPTVSSSRIQWAASVTGGFPVFGYTCSHTTNTVGNFANATRPSGTDDNGNEYRNGINRLGFSVPPAGGQSLLQVNAAPAFDLPGLSTLDASSKRPAYFGWGGFFNGSVYSLPLANVELIAGTVWPRCLTATEFRRAMLWNEHVDRPIWIHGDSGGNLGYLRDSIVLHAKKAGFKYIPTFRTARGGAGLIYQKQLIEAWLATYPVLAESTLVLNESGFDIGNQFGLDLVPLPPLSINSAISLLNGLAQMFPENSFLFLEPQTNLAAISGTVTQVGIARSGTSSTIVLAADATSTSIVNQAIRITSGAGAGQTRMIQGYNTSTKQATVTPDWTAAPDATSQYRVLSAIEYLREFITAIRETFPDGYVANARLLQSQYATPEEYDAATISGTIPAALRSDNIHLNFGTWQPGNSGHYWVGLAAFRKLRDLGMRL